MSDDELPNMVPMWLQDGKITVWYRSGEAIHMEGIFSIKELYEIINIVESWGKRKDEKGGSNRCQ